MSTSAFIIQKINKDCYRGIYCHFDGYEEGVGKTLVEHYQDPVKISELIDLGDISYLGERVHPLTNNHTFLSPEIGTTKAYHRDRGEDLLITEVSSLQNLENSDYIYVFEDGIWYIISQNIKRPVKGQRLAKINKVKTKIKEVLSRLGVTEIGTPTNPYRWSPKELAESLAEELVEKEV